MKLIEATEVALEAAIAVAQPGGRLGDISAAIGEVAQSYGYRVNNEFGGHGIGRTMHEAPHIPNSGRPGVYVRNHNSTEVDVDSFTTPFPKAMCPAVLAIAVLAVSPYSAPPTPALNVPAYAPVRPLLLASTAVAPLGSSSR